MSDKYSDLTVQKSNSIVNLDKKLWDRFFSGKGIFDYGGLLDMEKAFADKEDPREHADFHYFVITEKVTGKVVLATFFSNLLCKNDIDASVEKSIKYEKVRLKDPLYKSTRMLVMGASITEGDHLYINYDCNWQLALELLFSEVQVLLEQERSLCAVFRDLEDEAPQDKALIKFLTKNGFYKLKEPPTYILEEKYSGIEAYLAGIGKKNRHNVKKEMLAYADRYYNLVTVRGHEKFALHDYGDQFYSLYRQVKDKSFKMNTYAVPKSFFYDMLHDPNWYFKVLYLKGEYTSSGKSEMVGFISCYFNSPALTACLLGLDYKYAKFNLYKVCAFQAVEFAIQLGAERLFFGPDITKEGGVAIKRTMGGTKKQRYSLILPRLGALKMMVKLYNCLFLRAR